MSGAQTTRLAQIGAWVWGIATVVLAVGFLSIVLVAAFHIERVQGPSGDLFVFSRRAPSYLAGLFYAVKENGSLIAGILGFSGVAWAQFYRAGGRVD